jgi:hypothetical protein
MRAPATEMTGEMLALVLLFLFLASLLVVLSVAMVVALRLLVVLGAIVVLRHGRHR